MKKTVLHCTKRLADGSVKDWTQDTQTNAIKENPKEAKAMEEFMRKIEPKR